MATPEQIVDEMDQRWRAEVAQEGERRGIVVLTVRRDTLVQCVLLLSGVWAGMRLGRAAVRG